MLKHPQPVVFHNVNDQVSHPYSATGVIVVANNILKFQYCTGIWHVTEPTAVTTKLNDVRFT
jgi:hypothetical protein